MAGADVAVVGWSYSAEPVAGIGWNDRSFRLQLLADDLLKKIQCLDY